jgi:hypothetical protein
LAPLVDRSAADWLVLRDGTAVETRGQWEVRGQQVIFTLPNGTFSSLRLDSVDLDASHRLSEQKRSPAPEPAPPPRREPVLVLTDRDLPRAPMHSLPEIDAEADEGEEGASAAGLVSGTGLQVVDWSASYVPEQDGAVLMGALRNSASTLAFGVQVTVSVLDDEGEIIALAPARLSRPGIPPGATVSFTAILPGLVQVERAEFEVTARRAAMQPLPGAILDQEEP